MTRMTQGGHVVMADKWKQCARAIKRDAHALYLAARDPRVPWYAKALAIGVAAYALSPIDLISDFVPVLGYVDDLIIVPAGIALVIRLVIPIGSRLLCLDWASAETELERRQAKARQHQQAGRSLSERPVYGGCSRRYSLRQDPRHRTPPLAYRIVSAAAD